MIQMVRNLCSHPGRLPGPYPLEMNPLPGLKPGVSGLWHTCHDLRPCQTCRKRPPLRSERMPFIPRLESLGFSGMAYKISQTTAKGLFITQIVITSDIFVPKPCGLLASRYLQPNGPHFSKPPHHISARLRSFRKANAARFPFRLLPLRWKF